LLRIGYLVQMILDKLYVLKIFPIKDSRNFSPYLVGIYKKK